MSATPQDWKRLGEQIRLRREKLGLRREDITNSTGGAVTTRTLANYESGRTPARGRIPVGYYAVAEAIGWTHESVQRVLDDKAPELLEQPDEASDATLLSEIAARYAAVSDFGSFCERLGGGAKERDRFDVAARRLLESVPGITVEGVIRGQYALAAMRPHDPTGVPPLDDVIRAVRAVKDPDRPQAD